jgi:hypothetical protein
MTSPFSITAEVAGRLPCSTRNNHRRETPAPLERPSVHITLAGNS